MSLSNNTALCKTQLPRSVGSTDTSLWTHYNAGEREYCGNTFPDGMRKNDQLKQQIITPTTKSASHDVPISAQDILRQGIVSPQDWDQVDHPLVFCCLRLAPYSCNSCLECCMWLTQVQSGATDGHDLCWSAFAVSGPARNLSKGFTSLKSLMTGRNCYLGFTGQQSCFGSVQVWAGRSGQAGIVAGGHQIRVWDRCRWQHHAD